MATEVVMPQMGESLSEGTILRWMKQPGERVERDEPLFEITTDKVDTEVPAPVGGLLDRILVEEGETVSVGTVVAVIGDGTTEAKTGEATTGEAKAPETAPAAGGGHFKDAHETTLFRRRSDTPSAAPAKSARPRLSPAVLALAREHDIALDEIEALEGSGRGGRVTRRDVERHLEGRRNAASLPVRAEAPARAALEPPSRYSYRPEPEDELVPMSEARKEMAERMLWSQWVALPVTSFTECDVQRVARFRDEAGARFEAREGYPLSFLPFVAQAVVTALGEFPVLNASVVGERIALRKRVHLGVAMSLAGGLVAPVVRRADEASFIGLARAVHALTEQARRGELDAEAFEGASFTLTTPGIFGGMMGTPMIPQPQVAILALGAVQKKPVVIDDAIAIHPVLALALTFDHRVVDGATASRFLERIRNLLESFDLPDF